ncbi:MAG: 30S ribosomal protein S3 [Candidatus Omnitrophica bacterium CG1_02_49_10]|nr:MAG: 30S ribosomal protein S3 [Candidatus Omnitrophica bacterium CG1_02_49_10]
MGQKVHPQSFRLGYIKDFTSLWYAKKKQYAGLLHEDLNIRNYIKKNYGKAGIEKVITQRASDKLRVAIYTSRPGVIIGRGGSDIERLKEELQVISKKDVFIDIKEVKNPSVSAQLVADNIAFQLEKRIAFRRAMKRALQSATNAGAGGVKVVCSGRLGGAEIARREQYRVGKVPLQTLRADLDYGFTEACTTYGRIGVKVWIYHGDIIPKRHKGGRKHAVDAKTG